MAQFRVSVYVLVGLLSISKSVSASDPCTSYATLTGEVRRSVAYTLTPSDTAICDNFLIEQWYKIDSLAGNEIVRTCPSMLQCSTMYPLWMNGSLPDVLDGEVDRTVCQSGIGGCCESSFTIKVRNCVSFYVYYLKKTTGCPVSYCFGTLYVDSTTTETTTPVVDTTTSPLTTTLLSSVAPSSSPMIPGSPKHEVHKHGGEKIIFTAMTIVAIGVVVAVVVSVILYLKVMKKMRNDSEKNKVVPSYVNVDIKPMEKDGGKMHDVPDCVIPMEKGDVNAETILGSKYGNMNSTENADNLNRQKQRRDRIK